MPHSKAIWEERCTLSRLRHQLPPDAIIYMKRIMWFLGAFVLFIKRAVLTLLAFLIIAYIVILLLPPSVFLYMDAQDREEEFRHYLESQNIDSATLACPTVQSRSGYCTLVISEDGF